MYREGEAEIEIKGVRREEVTEGGTDGGKEEGRGEGGKEGGRVGEGKERGWVGEWVEGR